MTDNYIEILEALEHHGISKKTDLSPLLKELFPKPSDDSDYTVRNAISPYLHLIDEMSRNKHINYEESQNQNIGMRLNNGQHWFERPVFLSITSQGVEHLHRYYATKSSIDANKSSLKTNESVVETNLSVKETNEAIRNNLKSQNTLFWLTFGIAIIGVASQVGSFIIDFRDNKKDIQIERLIKELQARDTLILRMQNPRASQANPSSLQTTANDLSKKN